MAIVTRAQEVCRPEESVECGQESVSLRGQDIIVGKTVKRLAQSDLWKSVTWEM